MFITALHRDVPVVPDGDAARDWARRELSEPIYHEQQSLLARLIGWIEGMLRDAQHAAQNLDWRIAALVLTAVVVVAGGIALLVTGPIRRSRSAAASSDIFAETTLSAAEHRSAAELAATRGDWHTAVLERFRAIVRSLEERVILDERPGRTAHEAAAQSATALPVLAGELLSASEIFDAVCYGSGHATRDTDAELRSLDRKIQAAHPVRAREQVPA